MKGAESHESFAGETTPCTAPESPSIQNPAGLLPNKVLLLFKRSPRSQKADFPHPVVWMACLLSGERKHTLEVIRVLTMTKLHRALDTCQARCLDLQTPHLPTLPLRADGHTEDYQINRTVK